MAKTSFQQLVALTVMAHEVVAGDIIIGWYDMDGEYCAADEPTGVTKVTGPRPSSDERSLLASIPDGLTPDSEEWDAAYAYAVRARDAAAESLMWDIEGCLWTDNAVTEDGKTNRDRWLGYRHGDPSNLAHHYEFAHDELVRVLRWVSDPYAAVENEAGKLGLLRDDG